MMRAFFISTCVLSIIYIVACSAISKEVSEARWSYLWDYSSDYYGDDYYGDDSYGDSYDSYGYDDYSAYEDEAAEYTRIGGVVSVLYMLISAGAFLLGLLKIKTKTMKVISIIGLVLSGLFFLIAMLPIASPNNISFDEAAPAFILSTLCLLGLHIVGIVHAFKTST